MTSAAGNRTILCAVCGTEFTYRYKGTGRLRATCDKRACKAKHDAQKRAESRERAKAGPDEYPTSITGPELAELLTPEQLERLAESPREVWLDEALRRRTSGRGGEYNALSERLSAGFDVNGPALDDYREPEKPLTTIRPGDIGLVRAWYAKNSGPIKMRGEEVGRTASGSGPGPTLGGEQMRQQTERPVTAWVPPKAGEIRGSTFRGYRPCPEPADVARLLDDPLDSIDVELAYTATRSADPETLAAWLNARHRRRSQG